MKIKKLCILALALFGLNNARIDASVKNQFDAFCTGLNLKNNNTYPKTAFAGRVTNGFVTGALCGWTGDEYFEDEVLGKTSNPQDYRIAAAVGSSWVWTLATGVGAVLAYEATTVSKRVSCAAMAVAATGIMAYRIGGQIMTPTAAQ